MTDAELVKAYRESIGWTQEQVARRLDMSLRHYQRLERGDLDVQSYIWRSLVSILVNP